MTDAPFWVTFPTHAMPKVNWSDHTDSHRAVMGLFSHRMPGPADTRRAAGQVLFRVDHHVDGTATVLVQTREPIELLPPSARATTVPPAAWDVADGAPVLFRVAVTALRRRTERDEAGRRHEVLTSVEHEAVPAWVVDKLAPAMKVDEVLNHTRQTMRRRSSRRTAPPFLVVDTIDGIASVTDGQDLKQLRLHGVGRNKAYGAGLLTVRPLA